MATKNFDSLYEQLLTELMPVYPGEEGSGSAEEFSSELEAGAENMPGGGYLFGKIAKALNIDKKDVIKMISKDLFDKIFPGGVNKANNNTAFRQSISNALREIVNKIQEEKDVKISGAGEAVAGYTARIVDQLTKNKKVYGEEASVTKEDVSSAIETVANEEESVEGSKPTSSEEPEEESGNRTIVRIERMITDLVDDSGVLASDVLEDVYRKVLASDGLGIEEKNIKGFIKSLANRLVDKQILERKGQYLKLGNNFEKYEASKSEGSEAITDDDLIQKYTGIGARETTSRGIWGGEE